MEAWREEKAALVRRYRELNQTAVKGGIVFAGSSLMEMFPIEEWVRELPDPKPAVYNRGVGGYTTADYLPILDICVWELKPSKVFINIGTNDLSDSAQTVAMVIERYDRILDQIEEHLPGVTVYLMAYYPVNPEAADEGMKQVLAVRSNERIAEANAAVQRLAQKHGQKYIDLNGPLKDSQGRLKAEYTIEGMHINPDGYRTVFDQIRELILA